MPYPYTFEALLEVLEKASPGQVEALRRFHRHVDKGLLSVGLKIHCSGTGTQFDPIIERLGGRRAVIEVNHYRREQSALCWVLPPVGSAQAAVVTLECIERTSGLSLFHNPEIQIQVCSPGRLREPRAALLGIAFYLGSDHLRHYTLDDLATTFSERGDVYSRGKRLVLYDAGYGDFDKNFEWWQRISGGLVTRNQLQVGEKRTDVLTAQSKLDVFNINLVATLLVHEQHGGYWAKLGHRFAQEMYQMLRRHGLEDVAHVRWLRVGEESEEREIAFLRGLKKLMAYAFDDVERIELELTLCPSNHPERRGILWETKTLLQTYRDKLTAEARLLKGGRR